jgi:hypothetical protein
VKVIPKPPAIGQAPFPNPPFPTAIAARPVIIPTQVGLNEPAPVPQAVPMPPLPPSAMAHPPRARAGAKAQPVTGQQSGPSLNVAGQVNRQPPTGAASNTIAVGPVARPVNVAADPEVPSDAPAEETPLGLAQVSEMTAVIAGMTQRKDWPGLDLATATTQISPLSRQSRLLRSRRPSRNRLSHHHWCHLGCCPRPGTGIAPGSYAGTTPRSNAGFTSGA